MPIDPDALVKLVKSVERNGVAEKAGIIVGEVMNRIVTDPSIDYDKFFKMMGSRMTPNSMGSMAKVMKVMGKLSVLANPMMKIASSDLIMAPVGMVLGLPIVQRISVNIASKVGIMVLKGNLPSMPKLPFGGKAAA